MRWNSLGTRLILSFAAFVLASVVVVAGFSYYRAQSALEDSLGGHGRLLVSAMESHAGDHLVMYDHVYLRDYVSEMTKREAMVSFAAVMNAEGVVVAHSDHAMEGKPWEGPDEKAGGQSKTAMRVVPYKSSRVLELSAPVVIGGKKWGSVQVGMNYREVDATLRKLAASIALVGVIALALAIIGVRAFTTKITSGLDRLVETTGKISEGELRIEVPEEGYDEIRALAHAFNTMRENLRHMLRQIQDGNRSVEKFTADVLTAVQEQASAGAQQAASVSEVTATVEELSRTSRQIAKNAEAVKEAAEKAVEIAQQGNVLIRQGTAANEQIKDRIGDIAKKTLFLGEKSHEIGKVMDIIKEIASEIHLLALNAAIESAAAGEHGRRFAVVASEVRRLADKTRESTETIRSIISEIQGATATSVQTTEQGIRDIDRWRETFGMSSAAFEEIIRGIERTSEASMQISLATNQQTSANEQVVQAMQQIAEAVRQAAAHMKESSEAAGELKGMLAKQREMASVFQV